MAGSSLLTFAVGAALLGACATSGSDVQLPLLAGTTSVADGARVRVSPEGVAGGVDGFTAWLPLKFDVKQLDARVAELRSQAVASAQRSFGVDADTVSLWADGRVPFSVVRTVTARLSSAGFKRIFAVGRAPDGKVTATRLHASPPTDPSTRLDMSLRWGKESKPARTKREAADKELEKAEAKKVEDTKTLAKNSKIAKILATDAGLLAALSSGGDVVGVEVGLWEQRSNGRRSYRPHRKPQCPAIPYDKEGQLDTGKLPAIAAMVCDKGKALNLGIAPRTYSRWSEVAALAHTVATSGSCKTALFMEKSGRRPSGCAPPSNIFGSAGAFKGIKGNAIGGLIGAKGTQIGSGGLGMRGAGLGGGGTGGGGGGGFGRIGGTGRGSSFGRGFGGGRSNLARVVPGKTNAIGHCDKDIIRRIVRRYMNQFRYCYEKQLVKSPKLEGKVRLKWVIDRQGLVSKAEVIEDTLASPKVGQCIQKRVLRMRFPAPKKGICVVTYPVVFKRNQSKPKPAGKASKKP